MLVKREMDDFTAVNNFIMIGPTRKTSKHTVNYEMTWNVRIWLRVQLIYILNVDFQD